VIAIEEWRARGRLIPTRDGRVWATEAGKARAGAPPVLVLHGFPTSSWDFANVAARIAGGRKIVLFDFLGYGLSEKPVEHGYSLFEQADAAIAVAHAFEIERAHVWGHDMGTSVLTELLARRERGLLPFRIESAALMNGSVFIEMASLTLGQQLLRSPLGAAFALLSTRATFKAQMRRIFGRKAVESELDVMWELVAREDGVRRLPALIQYVAERSRFARRWTGALERLDLPALVAWGRRDPVAVFAIAERLARTIPRARLESYADLGHYPQGEDPERVAASLALFWDSCSSDPVD
jgi:pimeloyl-ACP methyl ester carboxylesterase